MRISIMQPSYLPYVGFFDLMKRCDAMVLLNDVQYTKNDWRNRNRVKTPQGTCWLTIPMGAHKKKKLNEVKTPDGDWRETHIKTLRMNYARAAAFREYMPGIEKIINMKPLTATLDMFNVLSIIEIMKMTGVKCGIRCSSGIGFSHEQKTDRLISICKYMIANEYLSPNGSKPYLEEDKFKKAGIRVIWQDYKPKEYPQQWGPFVSHLSIADLILNCGGKSYGFI